MIAEMGEKCDRIIVSKLFFSNWAYFIKNANIVLLSEIQRASRLYLFCLKIENLKKKDKFVLFLRVV